MAVALAVSLAFGAVVWVVARAVRGAEVATPVGVLSFILAVVTWVNGVVRGWWGERRRAGLQATAEQVEEAARALAGMVGEQWDLEMQARGLGDPEPMPVRWRLSSPALMDHPGVISPAAVLTFAESADRIGPLTAAFRALPRRRLVITGGPGTGKTTLAVQLLRELLAHPEPGEPVPVLFTLTSWDPDTQPRVQDWLATQLEETYPVVRGISPDAAAGLVAQNRVLPILDGLDEVHPVRRAGIITALNASLTGGVVLTSRRPEYRTAISDAGDVLTAAAAISPFALTPAEAAAYLDKSLLPDRPASWDEVLARLRSGAAESLAAVTATPFGLWLVRTVYLGGSPADRPDPAALADASYPTAERLTHHLFDRLIPAVIRSRPPLRRRRRSGPDAPLRPSRRCRPDQIHRWLTTLATQLRDTNTRDWRWWQMAPHTFHGRRARLSIRLQLGLLGPLIGSLVGAVVGPVVGLTLELVGGSADGFMSSLDDLIGTGIGYGLVVGLVVGLVGGLVVKLTGKLPEHANLRLAGRGRELLTTLAVGLARGAAGGLTVWLMLMLLGLAFDRPALVLGYGLAAAAVEVVVVLGLMFGLPSGLVFGLARFFGSTAVPDLSASPTLSYRGDVTLSLIKGLAVGLTFGLTSGLFLGLPTNDLTFALVAGLAVGLPVGLAVVLTRSWFGFAIAATRHALRRPTQLPMPWRVMTMLQDCHRLGLLRTVGPVYQFRHAQLQDYLALPVRSPRPIPVPSLGTAEPSWDRERLGFRPPRPVGRWCQRT